MLSDSELLDLLRQEEERSRKLQEALDRVIFTVENVHACGGWGAVTEVIASARRLLKAK